MDNFTAAELAYKNGFDKGFLSGETEAIRKMLLYLEARMSDTKTCPCGHPTLSKFYNYCPHCGKKY